MKTSKKHTKSNRIITLCEMFYLCSIRFAKSHNLLANEMSMFLCTKYNRWRSHQQFAWHEQIWHYWWINTNNHRIITIELYRSNLCLHLYLAIPVKCILLFSFCTFNIRRLIPVRIHQSHLDFLSLYLWHKQKPINIWIYIKKNSTILQIHFLLSFHLISLCEEDNFKCSIHYFLSFLSKNFACVVFEAEKYYYIWLYCIYVVKVVSG